MFWLFLTATLTILTAAMFFIMKGWAEFKGPVYDTKEPPYVPPEKPEGEKEKKEDVEPKEEVEISIDKPAHGDIGAPAALSTEDFYREFGKSNIVEFPAKYIDKERVEDINGNNITILQFAKNCYKEIGYKCIDFLMTKEEKGRIYKTNIFELISDHYASTDEGFIKFFAQLKEGLKEDIGLINKHSDITPSNKKALIGKRTALPQLIVWNNAELFLVTVKSKRDPLKKSEIDFLKEFIVDKKIFSARVFRVTERQTSETKRTVTDIRAEGPLPKEAASAEEEKPTRRPFSKKEVEFLIENKDRLTNEELAKMLNRTVDSVTHKLSREGLARESYEWARDKDTFLKKNITKLSYRELAEKLGTTIPSIRARCKKLKIKK
ncbi:MAG: hypothetical protein ISS34_06270 [Candidatus Omnitrophica bacterium]|nr:hypothetical protein [Candidatus Omnitrophota bacterium]